MCHPDHNRVTIVTTPRTSMALASRVAHLSPSATLTISAKAAAMKAEGIQVCSLGAGEPDFDTPEHIKAAAIRALQQGMTKYGPSAGIRPLRQAIAQKLQDDNHLAYTSDQVMVSNGGKQTLYNLAMVLLDPGDEVIIPCPYWVSYPDIVRLAGGNPVLVPTDTANGFKITPSQLKDAITPATKLFVLNSPNNPTGAVYSREELTALADVLLQHPQITIVSDEIYEKLIYDGLEHVSIASLDPALLARTVISGGFAKAYAMTGWRMGYLAGPQEIITAAINLQSHSTSNVCTFAQYGALEALTNPLSPPSVDKMRNTFSQRRDRLWEGIQAISGLSCSRPMGAFYLWVNIEPFGLDSLTFCNRMLTEQHVAGIPGVAFGGEGWIRLSYATSFEAIEMGIKRIHQFVSSL